MIAENLLKFCSEGVKQSTKVEVAFNQFCLGYIAAVLSATHCDTLGVNGTPASTGFRSMPPQEASLAQIQKVVTKWLNSHPELLHLDGGGVVAKALQETWPCP